MTKEQVEEIIEQYGVERILEDNETTFVEMFDLLNYLGYIDLGMYTNDDDWS